MKTCFASALILVLFASCAGRQRDPVCDDLFVEHGKTLLFTKSEKKLLCGDPKDETWDQIPRPQQIYHLKTFLLDRGYYAPKITEEPKRVLADLGPRVNIDGFEIWGWPKDVRDFRERRYRHSPMNPKSLDLIVAGALEQLKNAGYPCAEVNVLALPNENLVKINVEAGIKHEFGETQLEPADHLDARTLRRFEAFRPIDDYDYRLLQISEKRIRDSGLVQDVIYLPHCEGDHFYIGQKAYSGKSRFISLGAGFDTEQLAIAQARLSFNRLSEKGSSLESLAYVSLREQSLSNKLKFHLWPPQSRTDLYSDLDFKHSNERQYDSLLVSSRAGVGMSVETHGGRLDFEVGPLAEYLKVYRGVGLPENRNIAMEFSATFTSHLYEYYLQSPQRGHKLSFTTETTLKQIGATFAANITKVQEESLFTVYDNRLFDLILGMRASYGATYSLDGREKDGEIPAEYRHFLGGSANMRGFGRNVLPDSGLGALTAGYFGAEFRLARMMKFEPLIFGDIGAVGHNAYAFDTPYYLSPGVGFRWLLPIGILRGTGAHGYSINGAPGEGGGDYQFFMSFGEEF